MSQEPFTLQAGIDEQIECTGPDKKLDLQAPRTASSGRRLMLTNAGGSYGFRLSFSPLLFGTSLIFMSAFVLY